MNGDTHLFNVLRGHKHTSLTPSTRARRQPLLITGKKEFLRTRLKRMRNLREDTAPGYARFTGSGSATQTVKPLPSYLRVWTKVLRSRRRQAAGVGS